MNKSDYLNFCKRFSNLSDENRIEQVICLASVDGHHYTGDSRSFSFENTNQVSFYADDGFVKHFPLEEIEHISMSKDF